MAVTPNYSWPVPVNTDYVKDGAEAIKALGDAIDSTVFGLPSGALTLVKSQVIGTAVSSVAVSDAFSATYDAYEIIITGGTSTAPNDISLIMTGSTTGYYLGYSLIAFASSAISGVSNNNASSWTYVGRAQSDYINLTTTLINPFLAKPTIIKGASTLLVQSLMFSGYHAPATSYTGFTISTTSMTGGTIRVYGYQN